MLCTNVLTRYYTMKNRSLEPEATAEAPVDSLCRALLALDGVAEMRAFLRDLCTPAELEALVDRWRVVPYLLQGRAYREIHERTAVSVTTIGRVARFLSQGNGGYQAAHRAPRGADAARQQEDGIEPSTFRPRRFYTGTPMSADKPRERLRIAVQKSGRLADASQDLLARCGLKFRQSRDKLFCFGENHAIDLLLVRDDDIPGLIAQGVCDLGVVGRNVLAEQLLAAPAPNGPPARELYALGFGRCRLGIAVAQDAEYTNPQSLAGMRIATTYPALLGDWLQRNGVDAQDRGAVRLGGDCTAPGHGGCDLRPGLQRRHACGEPAARSGDGAGKRGGADRCRDDSGDERGELRELLLRRIDGVIQVRESKLILLHAARSALPAITRLLPNGQEPTITSVEGSADNVSLQALCYGSITWQHLEEMKRAGASRLLVLPVEKMLA